MKTETYSVAAHYPMRETVLVAKEYEEDDWRREEDEAFRSDEVIDLNDPRFQEVCNQVVEMDPLPVPTDVPDFLSLQTEAFIDRCFSSKRAQSCINPASCGHSPHNTHANH